jgi:hypothetical protein
VGIAVPPGPGAVPGEREVRIGEHSVRLVPPGGDPPCAGGPAGDSAGEPAASEPAASEPAASEPAASEPTARLGISATAGKRVLCDLFGIRFARL